MASENFKLTFMEGQFLLRYSSTVTLPDSVGSEKFEAWEQDNANDQIRTLRKDLRAQSPILREKRKLCFGGSDNWKPKKTKVMCQKCDREQISEQESYDMIDPEREFDVVLSGDAIQGTWYCLYLATSAKSPFLGTMAEIDEVVWSLAAKLGWDDDLRKILKIGKAKDRPRSRTSNVTEKSESDQ